MNCDPNEIDLHVMLPRYVDVTHVVIYRLNHQTKMLIEAVNDIQFFIGITENFIGWELNCIWRWISPRRKHIKFWCVVEAAPGVLYNRDQYGEILWWPHWIITWKTLEVSKLFIRINSSNSMPHSWEVEILSSSRNFTTVHLTVQLITPWFWGWQTLQSSSTVLRWKWKNYHENI